MPGYILINILNSKSRSSGNLFIWQDLSKIAIIERKLLKTGCSAALSFVKWIIFKLTARHKLKYFYLYSSPSLAIRVFITYFIVRVRVAMLT